MSVFRKKHSVLNGASVFRSAAHSKCLSMELLNSNSTWGNFSQGFLFVLLCVFDYIYTYSGETMDIFFCFI